MQYELPKYNSQGMGCGLEDENITDRYVACEYGFNEAISRCRHEVIAPMANHLAVLEEKTEVMLVVGAGRTIHGTNESINAIQEIVLSNESRGRQIRALEDEIDRLNSIGGFDQDN